MKQMHLHDFINRLRELEAEGFADELVLRFLSQHEPTRESLAPCRHFDSEQYARNLIYRDDVFELLLLCWRPHQATPVHDHGGQRGWVRVIEGSLSLINFDRVRTETDLRQIAEGESSPPGSVVLIERNRLVISAGQAIMEVTAPETIHRVGAATTGAVSLHLYSRPIETCFIFDLVSHSCRRGRPRVYSRFDAFA